MVPEQLELSTLQGMVAELQTLSASVLGSRAQFASDAGITFNGGRNVFQSLGYKRVLLPQDYRSRYMRNAVAARVVETLPRATWRAGGELVEDEDPEVSTTFEESWDALNTRLNIWSMFQRADILCGLGRYAVILLGAPGKINEPLVTCKPQDLAYLMAFSEEDAPITAFEMDEKNPRFSLPTQYSLRRVIKLNQSVQPPLVGGGQPVHWTRVIHIADGLLDDNVFGLPRLERVWNLLDDLEKVTGGGAEAFWKRADAGMHIALDPMLKPKAEDLTALKQQIRDYVDGLQRVLTTRGVEVNTLSSNVADFKGPADAILEQVSAGSSIPQRLLMGSERGELASTQDRDNWADRVSDRRYEYAGPRVVRPFVDRLVQLGVLPKPTAGAVAYEVVWPEVQHLDEAAKAEVAYKLAWMNERMPGVITAEEIRDRILDLPPVSAATKLLAASARFMRKFSVLRKADRVKVLTKDDRAA